MSEAIFEDDGSLDREIDAFLSRLTKPSRINADIIADRIREQYAENFSTESAGGDPWKALSPVTVAERESLGFPGEHPILVRTGELLNSFTNPNNANHIEDVVFAEDELSFRVGSQDDRADRLNRRRPMNEFGDGQLVKIGDAVDAFLDAFI